MGSVIEVENLHKRYGGTVAVDDVSFTVAPGEIFGILGRNGAGKTTTVECLMGLRTPDRGWIRILGRDPRRPGWMVGNSGPGPSSPWSRMCCWPSWPP